MTRASDEIEARIARALAELDEALARDDEPAARRALTRVQLCEKLVRDLRDGHEPGIISGVTSAQQHAAQSKRRGAAVAVARAETNGHPVALAIAASKWKNQTAYARRLRISQPALSRYISGSLECPPEVADQVQIDFALGDATWRRPPRR